jgi:hypothetical protein
VLALSDAKFLDGLDWNCMEVVQLRSKYQPELAYKTGEIVEKA